MKTPRSLFVALKLVDANLSLPDGRTVKGVLPEGAAGLLVVYESLEALHANSPPDTPVLELAPESAKRDAN